MPPKSSKVKYVEWSKCETCGCTLCSKDTAKHSEICYKGIDVSTGEFGHGFIKDEAFHGIVTKVELKGETGRFTSENSILLNPSTMRQCGLCIGRFVICLFKQKAAILSCWPVMTVLPGNVGFSDIHSGFPGAKIKPGDTIIIKPFFPPENEIKDMMLKALHWKEFMSSCEFKNLFKAKKFKQFTSVGSFITLKYYGQLCEFFVCSITLFDGITHTAELDKIENVSCLCKDIESKLCVSDADLLVQNDKSSFSELCNSTLSDADSRLDIDVATSTPVKSALNNENTYGGGDEHQNFFCITENTNIAILNAYVEQQKCPASKTITFESIGGLTSQIETITELVNFAFKFPFNSVGISTVTGILLFGPSGCGKTMIANAIQAEFDVAFMAVSGPEVFSKFYGETEAKLRDIFKDAIERAPSILFIDEVDTLCPQRDRGGQNTEPERRISSMLLSLIDSLANAKSPVVLIAATNKPDLLDASLRRPGRLDKEIEIGVPTARERYDILCELLKNMDVCLNESDILSISDRAHGYVAADLVSVCREALFLALKSTSHDSNSKPCITFDNLSLALGKVKPSAMREVTLEVPKVFWSDIGGNQELKHKLQQAIEWPVKHPDAFHRMGIKPPKGVLMYGPPGCSKTMIARAIATESGLNFFSVKGPELFSKWVGESERAVRDIFRKARTASPSIVFFDEIDALAVERSGSSSGHNVGERVLAQLLTEMDGLENLQNVVIVAATNRPDMIDKALLRPGRLDRSIYVPLPDDTTRREIIQLQFANMPVAEDVNIEELVSMTSGYSGAEIVAVCQEGALAALEEDMSAIKVYQKHFCFALQVILPRTDARSLLLYEKYAKNCSL